jgi:hypothetical protein
MIVCSKALLVNEFLQLNTMYSSNPAHHVQIKRAALSLDLAWFILVCPRNQATKKQTSEGLCVSDTVFS